MAPKDYVKRSKAPAKKVEPETPPLPWIAIILVLIAVIGFGYFLWQINGASDDPDNQPLQQKSAPEQQTPLPDMPEEQWEFIDTLENHSVEVDVPEPTDDGKQYQMQCGSFRTQEQAERMRAQLALMGQEAMIKATQGSNGLWHRVVLGPYDKKRAAERDRHQIRKLGITTCQIWLWR